MENKKIKSFDITIDGVKISISHDGSDQYIETLSELANEKIKNNKKKYPRISSINAVNLSLLQALDALIQLDEKHQENHKTLLRLQRELTHLKKGMETGPQNFPQMQEESEMPSVTRPALQVREPEVNQPTVRSGSLLQPPRKVNLVDRESRNEPLIRTPQVKVKKTDFFDCLERR